MKTIGDRLRFARKRRYATLQQAADALGIPASTLQLNENYDPEKHRGRPFGRERAQIYARRYGVSIDWLLGGKGDPEAPGIPVVGLITAGAHVEAAQDMAEDIHDVVTDLGNDNLVAYELVGESMSPRYIRGEYVLAERETLSPDSLINAYAVVHTADGRTMIKIIGPGDGRGFYSLISHNAAIETGVSIISAQRVRGALTGRLAMRDVIRAAKARVAS